jgi:hypothetical protein
MTEHRITDSDREKIVADEILRRRSPPAAAVVRLLCRRWPVLSVIRWGTQIQDDPTHKGMPKDGSRSMVALGEFGGGSDIRSSVGMMESPLCAGYPHQAPSIWIAPGLLPSNHALAFAGQPRYELTLYPAGCPTSGSSRPGVAASVLTMNLFVSPGGSCARR